MYVLKSPFRDVQSTVKYVARDINWWIFCNSIKIKKRKRIKQDWKVFQSHRLCNKWQILKFYDNLTYSWPTAWQQLYDDHWGWTYEAAQLTHSLEIVLNFHVIINSYKPIIRKENKADKSISPISLTGSQWMTK